ncbi:MAG: DUF983 domain-containing protein [Roseivirga sp.]|nr:DUF983 domain-containing protein [Roseivirga sp.]
MLRLGPIVKSKCPNCEKGSVFASGGNILKLKGPEMNTTCPVCEYKFEREPGYFFGAMFISYGLTIAQAMAVYFIIWTIGVDLSVDMIMLIITLVLVVLLFPNFRASRVIWMYIFTKKKI